MKRLYPILFGMLLVCTSCKMRTDEAAIVHSLDTLFTGVRDFSGVALLADKGKPVYHRAFGYRNFNTRERMDTGTVFELASVSKQFTAMIIMMLRREGKVDYGDSLRKFIPELPYTGITVRHLLNHTSGLPDYQALMDQHWDKSRIAGNDDNIEHLVRYHPSVLFLPGEKFDYSNTGYMLLATIAERASGMDFVDMMNARILQPLGMLATGIRTRKQKHAMANVAWGHIYVREKQRFVPADSFPEFNYTIWLGNRKGPGRVSSTTSDLLRWDRALHDSKLVDQKSMNEAMMPATLRNGEKSFYGFGWYLQDDPVLGKIIFHTGDNPGYKTIIMRFPDVDKTFILLNNNEHPRFDDIVAKVRGLLKTDTM